MSESDVPSVVLDAKEDIMTGCVIVNFDDGAPVPIEEVISYLESGPPDLNSRTRRVLWYSTGKTCGECPSICVHFKCALDWFFRLDILEALKAFFTRKGFAPCVVA